MTLIKDTINYYYTQTDDTYMQMSNENLVELCKKNKSYAKAFSALFCKNAGKTFSQYNKYKSIVDENDAISLLTQAIMEAITGYDTNKKAQFVTLLWETFKRALISEGIRVNRFKNRINNCTYELNSAVNYSNEGKLNGLRLLIEIDNNINPLEKNFLQMYLNGETMEHMRKVLGISIEKLRELKNSFASRKELFYLLEE